MSVTAIDISHLPDHEDGPRAAAWWGMLLLLVIESAVFGTLIASYFYLKMGALEWPPAGEELPKAGIATINTLILVASSIPMHLADQAGARNQQTRIRLGLIGGIALGTVFLILKVVEYSDVEYHWDDHAYGSIIWLIVGFHSAHVLSVVLKTLFMLYLAFKGYFTPERHLFLEVNGMYWHFVVGVWLPLYAVIYWVPRWTLG